MTTKQTVAAVAAIFAAMFAVNWIGDTFGNFYGWATVITIGWALVKIGEHYEEGRR